jgi:hypothetical protein
MKPIVMATLFVTVITFHHQIANNVFYTEKRKTNEILAVLAIGKGW